MKPTTLTFGAILIFATLCSLFANADSKRTWTKSIIAHQAPGTASPSPFKLGIISQEPSHLIGDCEYDNQKIENGAVRTVLIRGHKEGKMFWPDVSLEVSKSVSGVWRSIAKRPSVAGPDEVKLKPSEFKSGLMVKLDPFQRYIGRYKFGRIVLSSGEKAVFEMDNILPP